MSTNRERARTRSEAGRNPLCTAQELSRSQKVHRYRRLQLKVHDSDYAELRQVARQAVGRLSEHAHFVLLSAQGYTPPAIGGLLGYDVQTVRTWLKVYQRQGCQGLQDAPAAGDRPKTAT